MRKTKTLALLFAALAMGGASAARADVTAITVTTSNPRIGLLIQATASNDGNPPPVVAWEWSVLVSHGSDVWRSALTSQADSMMFAAPVPAEYTIGVKVTYGGRNPPPPKIVNPLAMEIAAPDDVKIDCPNPFTQSRFQGHQWAILLLTGGQNCGGQMTGLAQEKVINRTDWFGNILPNIDWSPTAPTPTFHLTANHIFDTHSCDLANWDAVPIGRTESGDQSLRIGFTYPAGDTQYYFLRKIHYVATKVDANNWSDSATLQ